MAKSKAKKAKKAKIKILFNAEWVASGMDKFGGRKAGVIFKETVKGLTLSGVKDWLKQKLDVAILPGGEPYRPTDDQLKESLGRYLTDDKELKRMARRYRKAYDEYAAIVSDIEKRDGAGSWKTTGMCVVGSGEAVQIRVAE